eukprot:6177662-Pleurochrysis_carterae.AAC.1
MCKPPGKGTYTLLHTHACGGPCGHGSAAEDLLHAPIRDPPLEPRQVLSAQRRAEVSDLRTQSRAIATLARRIADFGR